MSKRIYIGQGTGVELASSREMAHQEPLTKKELLRVNI